MTHLRRLAPPSRSSRSWRSLPAARTPTPAATPPTLLGGGDHDLRGGDPEAPVSAADLTIEAGANGVDLPDGFDSQLDGGPGAAWTAEDGYLYVFTVGSSTCPTVAEGDATLVGSDVVVTFEDVDDDKPCTMDMRGWTTVVKAPEGVDESADVTVKLDEAARSS
ncbi:hypothetical protein NKG05_07560 [Oerskovia sp. M15]